jgi:hypothetical protein
MRWQGHYGYVCKNIALQLQWHLGTAVTRAAAMWPCASVNAAKFTYEEAQWCAKARIRWCGVPSSFGMEHGDVGAEANNVREVLGRVVVARWCVSDGGVAFQEWRSDTMTW